MMKDDEARHCSMCGKQISEEYYDIYDGMCWECWDKGYVRRTNPAYLSKDEAARESRRTEEMVMGIADRSIRSKGATKLGETGNFIVDFDSEEKRVIVYGKEIQDECPFKLAFDKDDATKMVLLLKKACDFF